MNLSHPSKMVIGLASLILAHHLCSGNPLSTDKLNGIGAHDRDFQIRKLQASMPYFFQRESTSLPGSPSPSSAPSQSPLPSATSRSRMFPVISYGADPTGTTDSTDAILRAISDAVSGDGDGFLMEGIVNLGGVRVNLQGGIYKISRPIKLPAAGLGNIVIFGGTLKASDNFTDDDYLIDLSVSPSSSNGQYSYEYVTFRDLMLDCNYKGGGIRAVNALRTSIDNCYIAHFATTGIQVQGGHETYIRNSFLGQHITAGGDPHEWNFTGTAINLAGNDNAVTDVVIFSASTGIMISGQANIISGVHCYNKATGFGGTGIYLKLPGLTQTRIVNSYFDYTGIVAEDPVQLHISNCFFLGDAFVLLKSINGLLNGINIIDNMFSGSNSGVDIVQLDQTNGGFNHIHQVVVDKNNVKGMNLKTTVARSVVVGEGTSWTVDFSRILLFPRHIKFVQYAIMTSASNLYPNLVLRNISNNVVLIESDVSVQARISVTVDQGVSNSS